MKKFSRGFLGKTAITLSLVAVLGLSSTALEAASIRGKVIDTGGAALSGAIISLSNGQGRAESVYSDAQGRFSLHTEMSGKLVLRVRKRFYEDNTRPLELAAGTSNRMTVRLLPLTDADQLSSEHPALSHFSRIQFDRDESSPFSRRNFTRDCLSCHSLGGAYTRAPRPPEGWMPTVQRMHGYVGNSDQEMIKRRAKLLAKAFDGTPVLSHPQIPYDELVGKAKLYQWKLPGSSVPHDALVSSVRTSKVYIADLFAGGVFELDRTTDAVLFTKIPTEGKPPGGAFAKMGLAPPFGLTLPHGVHSLVEGKDGRVYLTDSVGSTLVEFDPVSRTFKHFEVGDGALYPHTIRIGKDGIIWFTIFASNQIGRFDPKTKQMKVIDLPSKKVNAGLFVAPHPYGIDVNPNDGSVWYAHFGNDTIGRVDPMTFEIREIDSPVHAPRRQHFDTTGALWVAGFADGAIARIDSNTWQSKVYALPTYAPNEIPAPYALAVHPVTQDVWINDTTMDLVWRFLPDEERFIAYPLPLKGSYTRDFSFSSDGWACTSNNPLPAATLEGFIPELICIDPQGALY